MHDNRMLAEPAFYCFRIIINDSIISNNINATSQVLFWGKEPRMICHIRNSRVEFLFYI